MVGRQEQKARCHKDEVFGIGHMVYRSKPSAENGILFHELGRVLGNIVRTL